MISLKNKKAIYFQIIKTDNLIDDKMAALVHLANFAYDPVNYEYFENLNLVEFFLDLVYMNDVNSAVTWCAIGGICNLSSSNAISQKMIIDW